MIQSSVYDYVKVLDKAADAAWLRNEAIANNIANAATPLYKREDVDFESQLRTAMGSSRYESMDAKVSRLNRHLRELEPTTYTDSMSYSYRLDGNNVDIDTENVELASEQLRYQTEIQSVTMDFTRLKTVIK